jgi:hypothetical protein
MNIFLKRLKAESPSFFNKLLVAFVAIGSIGTAFLAAGDSLPNYAKVIAPHLLVIGIVGAALSRLTVANPKDLENEEPSI